MKHIKRKFWGEFGSICGMVYATIGLYYAVSNTVGKKFFYCIIGFIIMGIVYREIEKNRRTTHEE